MGVSQEPALPPQTPGRGGSRAAPAAEAGVLRSAWDDFRRARRGLFVYDILFKLLEAWLLVPAVAWVLSVVLSRAGHIAVSNLDILDFLVSPAGLLYAALFATVAAFVLLLEQAGIMIIAALYDSGGRHPVGPMLRAAFGQALRVVRLGALKVALLALTLVPFTVLAALTYELLLSGHDINYYLTDRPPAFWVAAGIGTLLLAGALAAGLVLYVRWAFALPILLFEGQLVRPALRASSARVRGAGWRVALLLLGWQAAALLLGVAVLAGFRLLAATVLDYAGERPVLAILLLLVTEGGLVATVSFARVVGQGLITRRLYLLRSEQPGVRAPEGAGAAPPVAPWDWRLAWLSMGLFLLAPLVLWADLARYVAPRPVVRVTAHRGHSHAAPENTLKAVHQAIVSRADYVEVDVQRTADGVVVLLHDRDLKRVAGDSRRIDEITYAEARKLDVGRWFGAAFAGERIPRLADVLTLCRGRVKLNIEMKFYGPDRRLARDVARLVRERDVEQDCLVTSFSHDGLVELKRHNGRLRTGLIVGKALGDVSRLDVEALSVRADGLSDAMLRAAHRRGLEVHVWTVNDARQMARLIKRGVDNIITDDPDLGIRVRDEWAGLTGTERFVVAGRVLLGLDP